MVLCDEEILAALRILNNYYKNPILLNQRIFSLNRGHEGFPEPIKVFYRNTVFNLFAAIDCILLKPGSTLHILDFKTGQSDFDERQAFVYLLAASYLCPQRRAIASFYNLELWILASVGRTELNAAQCQEALAAVQRDLPDFGDRPLAL